MSNQSGFDPNYEFYEHFSNKPQHQVEVNYHNAYQSSVASEGIAQPTPKSNAKSNSSGKVSKRIIVLACAVAIAACSWYAANFIDNNQEMAQAKEYFEKIGIHEVMQDASWGSYNDSGQYVHGYNQSTLSDFVESQEDQDLALYGIYCNIRQNKEGNMDEIISRTTFADGQRFETMDAYFKGRGFVDSKGNPSDKVYEEKMTQLAIAKNIEAGMNSGHK